MDEHDSTNEPDRAGGFDGVDEPDWAGGFDGVDEPDWAGGIDGVDEPDWAGERFEAHRPHLLAVAYRMLGSRAEAEDAVQEAWFRYRRADTAGVDNLAAWLTTTVSRICLDHLRARAARREAPLPEEAGGPAAGTSGPRGDAAGGDPEHEAVLSDSVGVALLVVLDRLGPAERVAFVLHDLFALPFDQIAPIVGRTPATTKKLASRARHRVRGGAHEGTGRAPGAGVGAGADLARQRRVVDAFLAAARAGDIDGLVAVLAPDAVRRDRVAAGVAPVETRGAGAIARQVGTNAAQARFAGPALVDGGIGIVVAPRGRLMLALRLTVEGDRITEIDAVAGRDLLAAVDVAVLG